VARRLREVHSGDIVLAHLNKPAGGTAEGFAAALPQLQQRGVRFVKLSEATDIRELPAPAPRRRETRAPASAATP
jgi:hypothetical protein